MSKVLLNQALLIRDEKRSSANTAYRIGTLFINIIQKLVAGGLVEDGEIDEEVISNLRLSELVLDKLTVYDFIKCFGTLEFGEKEGFIDSAGNAQLQSLEVRSSLKVLEVIMNRLSAMEGDYIFTESGVIERVEHVEDNVYLLTMRKRWDYDFTAFRERDVVYGSLNTLLADGSIVTSWFLVLEVDTSANTLTVAMYGDSDVPEGANHIPVAGMTVCRRGNDTDEERQSCWYLSTYEGVIMYLEGVTKPILEESNYYLSLGRPKHLSLFNGLPINFEHPYLFARGAIISNLIRVDWTGNPVYEVVDVGPWLDDGEYIRGYSEELKTHVQHQVWNGSCCWRCVADAATVGVPPRWNNTQWACVVGDSNFTLAITSSRGRFFYFGKEYTTLGFVLTHGDSDISVDAWQVEWTRESGLADEDLLWNSEHADCGHTVDITPDDMPSNWYDTRKVVFRCTVWLKDGEVEQTMSETISIN